MNTEVSKEKQAKPQSEKLDRLVVKVALIMVVGSLAPLLDSTIVNVALKTIAGDMTGA